MAEAGLSTTGHPAAIAGAILWQTRLSGKLNGEIAADHADRHPLDEAELAHAGRAGVEGDHLAGEGAGHGGGEADGVHGTCGLDPVRW